MERNLMKMVPENFKVEVFPSFFNTTETERISTVLRENLSDFMLNTQKKVMFSIGVKVFNYPHKVNSVRILVIKMQEMSDAGGGNVKGDIDITPIKNPHKIRKAKAGDNDIPDDSNVKLLKTNPEDNYSQDLPPDRDAERHGRQFSLK